VFALVRYSARGMTTYQFVKTFKCPALKEKFLVDVEIGTNTEGVVVKNIHLAAIKCRLMM
jgi:hypothetical protein